MQASPELRFVPGDLVLVRYSTYPIWPGIIRKNLAPNCQRHVDILLNESDQEVLAYWVTFPWDDEEGWVAAEDIVPYHPNLASLARAPQDEEYEEQAIALSCAQERYAASNREHSPVSLEDTRSMQHLLELYQRGNGGGVVINVVYV